MPRHELLALSSDDLITLSNRGIVKRAQAEIDGGQLSGELEEDEVGNLSFLWSDDVQCLLPSGVTLGNGRCSCPATTLCRHLVRSVLFYQQHYNGAVATQPSSSRPTPQFGASQEENRRAETTLETLPGPPSLTSPTHTGVSPSSVQTPWNPGNITDEKLAELIDVGTLNRARRQWESGHVIELKRDLKPAAFIHTLGCNLRFLVPDDPRYTHCDCAETAPCSHVPLAIWAFRLLEEDKTTGLVSTRQTPLPIPVALLDEIEAALCELAAAGVSGAPAALLDRVRRLEGRCRGEGLIWPAEILVEIGEQCHYYRSHDARFAPLRVAELMGEICIRSDAIRSETTEVPPLFVRGSSSDHTTEVGTARLIGLGCGARLHQGPLGSSVELTSFLQDMDSGSVVAVRREWNEPLLQAAIGQGSTVQGTGGQGTASQFPGSPRPTPPRPFCDLAAAPAVKGVTMAQLGGGRLLVKGGKRSAGGTFSFGRASVSFNPQNFAWEGLRVPVLAEDFASLSAHLAAMPPTALRPRRVGENLHVCAVTGIEDVQFATAEQAVRAVLKDAGGGRALLLHPFVERGRFGVEALLQKIEKEVAALRFVAGWVHRTGPTLTISPISLIFEKGTTRTILQPWIASPKDAVQPQQDMLPDESPQEFDGQRYAAESWQEYPFQVMDAVGELLLTGLQRIDDRTARGWRQLLDHGASLGFTRILDSVERLITALEQKQKVGRWQWQAAAQALLEVAVLSRLAAEEI